MTADLPSAARLARAAASVLAAATLLAACSSSGSTGNGSVTSSSSSSSSSAIAPAASAASSGASSSSDTSAAAIGGSGSSSFCSLARVEKANTAKQASLYATDSPAQLEKFEEKALAELPEYAAQAPSALRPYLNTLITLDQKFFKVLQAAHFDFRKINPNALQAYETPAVTKATNTVDRYLTNVCKIPSDLPSS